MADTENLIHLIREHRQQAKVHTDAATEMANLLKAHMQAEQVSEVIDGERQLRAYIQERTGWEWDLRGASAGILIALQESGLLKVDNALFEAMRKGAPSTVLDDATRFRRQVVTSAALMVEGLK